MPPNDTKGALSAGRVMNSPDMFILPEEAVFAYGDVCFDPDFGLDIIPEDGNTLTFDDLIGPANEELARYGFKELEQSDFDFDPEYISAEVGDDEESASNSRAFIACQVPMHRELGMKVSREDTCISNRYGNFAEDMIILPDGYGHTYLNARRSSRFDCMSYIDIPKLRLATDIRPMRMDHSSTNDGKASMVGARMRWIPTNSPWRGSYEIFSLLQDVQLGLHRDRKFAYLPESLGGYGKEPPFRNWRNFESFMKAFKQGQHSLLIRNIVNRTIDYVGKLSQGERPAKDPLLSHIVRFQSSFHDWVKGRSIYAPVTWVDVPPEVAKHKAGRLGESSLKDEVLSRLLAEGKLLSEQKLEIAVEHNQLCNALLGSATLPEFKEIRDRARKEWYNLSVFSMENYGMIKELTLDQSDRNNRQLRDMEISLFYSSVYSLRYNLRHILGEEFVYFPEAMDEIYKQGPMKVKFSMQPRNKVGTRAFAAQRSDYKSDMIDSEEIHSLDSLMEYVRGGFVGTPDNVEMLNDDTSIKEGIKPSSYNIIVTDDKRLCKEAAREKRCVVLRIPVKWYTLVTYFGFPDWEEQCRKFAPGKEWQPVVLDTGSIRSFEEQNFRDGALLERPAIQKFDFWKGPSQKDPVIVEEFGYEYEVDDNHFKSLIHDQNNVLKLRRQHRGLGRLPGGPNPWSRTSKR